MTLRDIPVSVKLYFLLFITCGSIIALGIYGLTELFNMEKNTKVIFYDELLSLDNLTRIRFQYNVVIENTITNYKKGYISAAEAEQELRHSIRTVDSSWYNYEQTYLTPAEIQLIDPTKKMIKHTDSLLNTMVLQIAAGKDSIELKQISGSVAGLTVNLQRLIRLQVQVSNDFYNQNQIVYRKTSRNFKWIILLAVMFVFIISLLIVNDVRSLINKLKKSNELISESEKKYRYLFDHAPILIFIWDIETLTILEINELVKKSYGYSEEEWQKLTLPDIRPKEDRAHIMSIRQKFLDGQIQPSATRNLTRHIMKSGEIRYLNITGYPIEYRSRKAVLSLAEDITDRYMAEENIRRMNEEIKGLYKHLETIREDERTYLAREIHDELGQYITLLKMDVAWIEKRTGNMNAEIKDHFNKIYEHIDLTVNNMRRLITELRPPLLDDAGILATIEWHLNTLRSRTDINCTLSIPAYEPTLPPDVAIGIYRIYQEATTNILKHAQADSIHVFIDLSDDVFTMHISDNGIGITDETLARPKGYGIIGMKERASTINGTLSIKSSPAHGTKIVLQIPLFAQTNS